MRRFKEGSGHDRPFFQMEKSSVLNSHNKSSKNRPHDPPPSRPRSKQSNFPLDSHSLVWTYTSSQTLRPANKIILRAPLLGKELLDSAHVKNVFELNAGSIMMSKNDIDIFDRLFAIEINWPHFIVNGVIAKKNKQNSYVLICM